MKLHPYCGALRVGWRALCTRVEAGDASGTARGPRARAEAVSGGGGGDAEDGVRKRTSVTYTSAVPNSMVRVFGPDHTVTPWSRKPPPSLVRTRNTAGPYEAPGLPTPHYPKRRSPYKRTTALINALSQEEGLRLIRDGRAQFAKILPRPSAGQIIRVTYSPSLQQNQQQGQGKDKGKSKQRKDGDGQAMKYFTGIVIAARNRGLGSTVILRNVVQGVAIERAFPLYSPLVRNVEVVGQKRVVRQKLYYLRDKPLRESTVPNATKPPYK